MSRPLQAPARRLASALALAAALAAALGAGPAQAQPATGQPATPPSATPPSASSLAALGLPDTAALTRAFQRSPAWQAAVLGRQAEQAGLRQGLAAGQEWTASLSGQRWRQHDGSPPAQWQDWELGLDRAIRLPGKREAAAALGQARVAQADAALQRAWREQARQLLQLWGDWQRETAAAQVADTLLALLQRQAQAVATRQRLGDAARIETAQAQAAVAQAQAQAEAAAARASQARQRLDSLFPDTVPQAPWAAAAPAPAAAEPAPLPEAALSVDAQLAHSAELALARREAAALRALAAQEERERRPDPTVGLRLGSNRGGAERMVGLALSVPLGGEARAAAAEAAALRAAAAERQADELARQLRADAQQRLQAQAAAAAVHQRQREAAQRLGEVADTLARGLALGEGSLSDLLAARRLAHEQALAAAGSAVELRLAALRLQLESGLLWPQPDGEQSSTTAPTASR